MSSEPLGEDETQPGYCVVALRQMAVVDSSIIRGSTRRHTSSLGKLSSGTMRFDITFWDKLGRARGSGFSVATRSSMTLYRPASPFTSMYTKARSTSWSGRVMPKAYTKKQPKSSRLPAFENVVLSTSKARLKGRTGVWSSV